MLNAGTLTFEEFAIGEQVPLASIHDAVLESPRGRDDAVLFGAQAVNAYVGEPRMSQDINLVSTRAVELAEELREHPPLETSCASVSEFPESLRFPRLARTISCQKGPVIIRPSTERRIKLCNVLCEVDVLRIVLIGQLCQDADVVMVGAY